MRNSFKLLIWIYKLCVIAFMTALVIGFCRAMIEELTVNQARTGQGTADVGRLPMKKLHRSHNIMNSNITKYQ